MRTTDRNRGGSGARAPRAAPDLDDLAHRGGAPGDARVERADVELEAPRLELLELGHEGVEAAPLLVDEHDVASSDSLRGAAAARRLIGGGGGDVDQRGL